MPRSLPPTARVGWSAFVALLLAVAVAVVVVMALVASPADAARRPARRQAVAKLTVTQFRVVASRVTIGGTVALPVNTARQRRRTKVAFTLKDARRKTERFTVGINARRVFRLTRVTKLTGGLSLAARVTIAGKQSGRVLNRRLAVRVMTRRVATPGTGGGPSGAGTPQDGGNGPAPGGGGPAPAPIPDGATPLVGLFKLDEGRQAASGRLSGTYFSMLTPGSSAAAPSRLPNGNSLLLDQGYTPLRAGSDGGLSTTGYQPAPSPAFAVPGPPPLGNALANRVVQPQYFFGVEFSIVTQSTDPQTGEADPLPVIAVKDGKLSGQATAWAAQWNGQSFNQGAPKPDGSFASPPGVTPAFGGSGTVAVGGTYDAASGRFTLRWQSLIIGGPFNQYTGQWNLEGTFVPAAAA